jgi:RNA polymerase sigma-70 factor (ECF subfamily)
MTARNAPPPLDELLARREWVRRFARTLAKDDATADDLAQDAWVATIEHPPRHADAPAGWLRRVLVRRAMDVARGARRRADRENAASRPDVAPSTADVVAAAESHRRVVEAVMALDEPYRTTVLLRFFEDLPPRDVAARMNVPVETVRSRVRRAVEQLRARLDDEHDGRRAAWLAPLLVTGRDAPAPTTVGPAAKGAIAMTATKKAAAVVAALLALGAGVTAIVRARTSVESGGATGVGATPAAASSKQPQRRHADAPTVDAATANAVAQTSAAQPDATSAAGGRDFVVVAADEVGHVVEGVRIGVHAKDGQVKRDTGSDFSITRTDANGRAVFRVAGDVETVWAEPTDRSAYDFPGDRVRVAPGASGVRVVVERRAWIAGEVVGEDGMRRSGVQLILLVDCRQIDAARTDDDGRFRISVPERGVWDIAATGPAEKAPSGQVGDVVGEALGVASGAEGVRIVVRPVTGKGLLRVRSETSDGAPLSGVNLGVAVPGTTESLRLTTDASGRCTVPDVPDRRVGVYVMVRPGEVPVWETAGWINPWMLLVRPSASETVLVFQRGRAIRGRAEYPANVARPLDAAGKPARSIVVVQRVGKPDLVSTTWCDDEGRFTAWAPADAAGPFLVSAGTYMTPDRRTFQAPPETVAAGAENVVLKFAETKQ